MKSKKIKDLFDLDLQYFAEGSNDGAGNDSNNGGNEDQNSNNNSGGNEEKSFTQTEVSNMMTKEKNEGKRSVLKALGFKSEQEAMEAIKGYNEYLESQKSEAEKNKAAVDKANSEKDEALARAKNAENKLACYNAGVNSEYIDDVFAIASIKVTDEKDLETVLKEMKEDKKYESFFVTENSSSGSKGTGSNAGHGNDHRNDGNESYGKRLAEKNLKKNKKSSFFND